MPLFGGETLVRMIMESVTGLPADRITNDFAFTFSGAGDPSDGDYALLFAFVNDLYRTTATGATNPLGAYISGLVNRSVTHRVAMYAISAGDLGSPVYESDWLGPVAPLSSAALPAECAAVGSFHGNLTGVPEEAGSTRPKARRRGRFYWGPLIAETILATDPPYYFKDDPFLTDMRLAMLQLATSCADEGTWAWGVWSRVTPQVFNVVGGWTDDAPDTQRRRGPKASSRVTWGPF